MPRHRDTQTLDLLSWEPPEVTVGYSEEVTGRGSLDARIARIVAQALREARDRGLPREEVAAAMSRWLGRTISAPMLDKWASESSGAHRIPLDAFAALIEATGATDLAGFVPGLFGLAAVPQKYADLIELHLIEEHEAEVAARKQALQTRWRARR